MKMVRPGSGADDMGAGMLGGCLKWFAIIIVAAVIIIWLLEKYVF